jgi:chromosome segregation ATPase
MTLDQLMQTVEARIFSVGKHLWRDDVATQLRDQADQLSEQLQERTATLDRCRDSIRQARSRLAEKHKQETFLVGRIETYVHVADQAQAWQLALELDTVRQSLRREHDLLRHLEKAEREQRHHIGRLGRSLATLHEKLYLIP